MPGVVLFQSHLRLIHPIHHLGATHTRRQNDLTFQSHLCLNYLSTVLHLVRKSLVVVSIASAPNPPYPPSAKGAVQAFHWSFNRICA